MTPERWNQVKAVFQEAVRRPPEARDAYVTEACGDDAELGREVRGLLAGHAQANDGDATSFDATTTSALSESAPLSGDAGTRIGPYQLLHEIGHGGMGTVYLAVRADDTYKKQVALKLVRRGMDSDEILRRFRYERQIVAALDHPNVARLLDGGTAPDGRPYFVMEYVEGRPITEYCDSHRLDTRARLALLQSVCRAVHFAHQSLVVHRDLKPGNILIAADGTPKLLDFGIAKLLNPELHNLTVELTSPLQRLMTPEYASPEQVRGEPITTASDVYSLGVLLYEVLTGHKPYRVSSRASLTDIARAVCDEEPEKPSSAIARVEPTSDGEESMPVTPEAVSRVRDGQVDRLRRRLRGDVDTIILKAMRKEPARRYASAEQLAEDIGRHLDGRPVRAQRDTLGYRVTKFVKRHRAGVAASAAIALLLVGAVVVLLVQAARIRTERDTAQTVSQFLIDLFQESNPMFSGSRTTVTAREILDRGADRLKTELRGQPSVRGRLLRTIGKVYIHLGAADAAGPLLQEAYETLNSHLGESHPEVLIARTDLGQWQHAKSDYAAAERTHREVLRVRRAANPRSGDIAVTLNELGTALFAQGLQGRKAAMEEAEQVFRESADISRSLPGTKKPDLGNAVGNLGMIRFAAGDPADATPYLREAADVFRQAYGEAHPKVVNALHMLANVELQQQLLNEGAQHLVEVRALYERSFPNGSPQLSDVIYSQAVAEYWRGNFSQAEQFVRASLAMVAKFQAEGENPAAYQKGLAIVLWAEGKLAEADASLERATVLSRNLPAKPAAYEAEHGLHRALIRRDAGDTAAALAIAREFAPKYDEAFTPADSDRPWGALTYGSLLADTGDYAAAEPKLRSAYQTWQKLIPGPNWRTALAEAELARCLAALGRTDDARKLFAHAQPLLHTAMGPGHPRIKQLDAAYAALARQPATVASR